MTITKAYQILDTLIEQDKSFAIYRLPGEDSPRFVMQTSGIPSVYHNIEDLSGQDGFVFAPFRITKSAPLLLIRPDCTSLEDVTVTTRHTPEQTVNGQQHKSLDKAGYHLLFECFKESLVKEEVEKLVLSRSKTIERKESFSPGLSFFMAAEKYIYSYVYLFHSPKVGTWLGSTPEILLSGKGNEWSTIALAGTRFPNSHAVTWDDKNLKEQQLVTSYLSDQLSSFGISPRIEGPYTVKAGELAHLRTDFSFHFGETSKLGSLLKALHPTPAVSGLPKEKAYQFILENEGYDRLYYSGFLGMLDTKEKTDLYVNLRCMRIEKSSLTLFAGGGLLASSSEDEEWEETEHKLRTMLGILK